MKAFVHGRLVPEETAAISIFDRGFLYGDGLFETIRVHRAQPFRWTQHLERLRRGADFLAIPFPGTPADLLGNAHALIEANQLSDCLLRIVLSRGVGLRGYSPRGADHPTLVMSTHPAPLLDTRPAQWRLVTSSFRVPACDPLAAFKTCNKLSPILARAEAESRGADEALLLNTRGELAEAASGNLFWLEGETVCTPPLSTGILAGVTRGLVLELCVSLGLPIAETSARPENLFAACGAFLSLSSLGIVEAVELDGRALATAKVPHRIYCAYREALVKETT